MTGRSIYSEAVVADQLFPRAPKRKKQPTAETMREQLRLAADEIIALRGQGPMEFYRGEPDIAHEQLHLPPPPKPPSCRIEYSHGFGRLIFESEADFEAWKRQPWWRRFLGLRPPKAHMTDYEWRRWLDRQAPTPRGGYQPINTREPPRSPPKEP